MQFPLQYLRHHLTGLLTPKCPVTVQCQVECCQVGRNSQAVSDTATSMLFGVLARSEVTSNSMTVTEVPEAAAMTGNSDTG